MKQAKETGATFVGIGYYLPEKVLSNFDLEKMVDTSDEWILTRTGIRERRVAAENEASSDMAYRAAVMAMEDAGVGAEEIDTIIVGTVTPDMLFPSTACIVQDRLGAVKAAAFDVTAACSGFIYGVTLAQSMITTGKSRCALIVGVETLSRILDFTDRTTCVLFGDGAGAVVMKSCKPGEGILSTFMQSDGSYAELLYLPGGGSRSPLTPEALERGEQYVKMRGDGLFKYAVKAMVNASKKVLDEANLKSSDVDFLIPHQANVRIIDGVRKRLRIPKKKVIVNIDRVGNTSAASIPIALGEAKEQGLIQKGSTILMVGFGGGLTWGAVLLRYV
ncbi:MAG: ketoacyl-ACP synthase III [bacterium]|nr:MAG: ketoacyl-ACP synthase III [bacterium]